MQKLHTSNDLVFVIGIVESKAEIDPRPGQDKRANDDAEECIAPQPLQPEGSDDGPRTPGLED